jgi:hypothetical protein
MVTPLACSSITRPALNTLLISTTNHDFHLHSTLNAFRKLIWPTISPQSLALSRIKSTVSSDRAQSPVAVEHLANPLPPGSFYYKIGACRHGDRCSRKHVKPSYSQTILLPNLYQNPAFDPKNKMNTSQLQNHFDAFYEDFFCEMCKYGEVEEVVVCDNNNDRM